MPRPSSGGLHSPKGRALPVAQPLLPLPRSAPALRSPRVQAGAGTWACTWSTEPGAAGPCAAGAGAAGRADAGSGVGGGVISGPVRGGGACHGCPGTSSGAAAGSTITGWEWDFGDGTPPAAVAQVQHTYNTSGAWWPRLTVTNQDDQKVLTFISIVLIRRRPD